jgi:YggT family protein
MNTLIVIVNLVTMVLQWVIWAVVIWAVLSWLIAFNVINMQNSFVRGVVTGLDRFFDPMLRPIRRILPDMGGIDLAPMVLILLIMLVQRGLPAILLDTGMLSAG